MSQKAKKFWYLWDKAGILCILLMVMVVFGILDSRIVSPSQLMTALSRSAVSGIAAAGMMLDVYKRQPPYYRL